MSDTEQEQTNRSKLQQLADKIQHMKSTNDKLKDSQREAADSQLRSLQYKIFKDFNGVEYESQLGFLKDEANKLRQVLHNEQLAAQAKHSADLSNVKELEDIVHSWVAEQNQQLETHVQTFTEAHNSQLNSICQETKDSMIQSQSKYEETYESLSREVSALKQEAEKEKAAREQAADNIALTIGTQLQKFKEAVTNQTKVRLQSEQKIKALIDEVGTKLKTQLEKEKTKRQYMGRSLLSLVEAACEKLQRKLLK